MDELIKKALEKSGYDSEPTEENLIDCFRDYVAAGVWRNISIEDVEDISVEEMCTALIKL